MTLNMNKDRKMDGKMVKLYHDHKDITIPEELLTNYNLESVLKLETYMDEISDDQKQYLLSLIPGDSLTDKDAIVKDLFAGKISQAFNKECEEIENPLQSACQKIKEGYFCPKRIAVRKCRLHAVKAKHLLTKHSYYQTTLKQLILKDWTKVPNKLNCDPKLLNKPTTSKKVCTKKTKVSEKLQKQYRGILDTVRERTREKLRVDAIPTDDSEDEKEWQGNSKASPCFNYRSILADHKRRKSAIANEINKPIDLNTVNITLMDVVNRSFSGVKKASILKSSMLARKRRANDPINLKKKKLKLSNPKKSNHLKQNSTKKLKTPIIVKQEVKSKVASGKRSTLSLFSFIKTVVQNCSLHTIKDISDHTREMLNNSNFDTNWSDLVDKAVYYLATQTKGYNQFIQVDHSGGICKWIGLTDDAILKQFYEEWLKINNSSGPSKCQDASTNSTVLDGKVVENIEESTTEERLQYQAQERIRYNKPHKAHTYEMHGKCFNVGPVKGMYHEGTIGSKARGHVLLRDDRPSYVTILTLVRDAVARLPNGEGTRNHICVLLRDSEYLKIDVTDAQINSVVSGALDRLHYEKDPCVKYNPKLKLWFYLHGNRSTDELEQLHATNAISVKTFKTKKSNVDKVKNLPKVIRQDATNVALVSSMLNHHTNINPLGNKVVAPTVINTWTTIGKPNIIARPAQLQKTGLPSNSNFINKTITIQKNHPLPTHGSKNTRTIAYTVRPSTSDTSVNGNINISSSAKILTNVIKPKQYSASMLKVVRSSNKDVKLLLRQPDKDIRQPQTKANSLQSPNDSVKLANNKNQSQQITLQNKLKQQQIQADALRKLTEQLSAVSKRPIKIVHQSLLTDADNAASAHVINIGKGGELMLKVANSKASTLSNGHIQFPSKRVITVPRLSSKRPVTSTNAIICNKIGANNMTQSSQVVVVSNVQSISSTTSVQCSSVPHTRPQTILNTDITTISCDSLLKNSLPKYSNDR